MSASPPQLKAWRPYGPGKAGADAPVDRFASAFSLRDAVSLPSFCFLLDCSCFFISLSLKVESMNSMMAPSGFTPLPIRQLWCANRQIRLAWRSGPASWGLMTTARLTPAAGWSRKVVAAGDRSGDKPRRLTGTKAFLFNLRIEICKTAVGSFHTT